MHIFSSTRDARNDFASVLGSFATCSFRKRRASGGSAMIPDSYPKITIVTTVSLIGEQKDGKGVHAVIPWLISPADTRLEIFFKSVFAVINLQV